MAKSTNRITILGIDPGTIVMGYGLISIENNKPTLIEMGVLKLSAKDDAYQRLEKIHNKVTELITKHKPDSSIHRTPTIGRWSDGAAEVFNAFINPAMPRAPSKFKAKPWSARIKAARSAEQCR